DGPPPPNPPQPTIFVRFSSSLNRSTRRPSHDLFSAASRVRSPRGNPVGKVRSSHSILCRNPGPNRLGRVRKSAYALRRWQRPVGPPGSGKFPKEKEDFRLTLGGTSSRVFAPATEGHPSARSLKTESYVQVMWVSVHFRASFS